MLRAAAGAAGWAARRSGALDRRAVAVVVAGARAAGLHVDALVVDDAHVEEVQHGRWLKERFLFRKQYEAKLLADHRRITSPARRQQVRRDARRRQNREHVVMRGEKEARDLEERLRDEARRDILNDPERSLRLNDISLDVEEASAAPDLVAHKLNTGMISNKDIKLSNAIAAYESQMSGGVTDLDLNFMTVPELGYYQQHVRPSAEEQDRYVLEYGVFSMLRYGLRLKGGAEQALRKDMPTISMYIDDNAERRDKYLKDMLGMARTSLLREKRAGLERRRAKAGDETGVDVDAEMREYAASAELAQAAAERHSELLRRHMPAAPGEPEEPAPVPGADEAPVRIERVRYLNAAMSPPTDKEERKVTVEVALAALDLPPAVRQRLKELAGPRLKEDEDVLVIKSDKLRNKHENTVFAVRVIRDLLEEAFLVHMPYTPHADVEAEHAKMVPPPSLRYEDIVLPPPGSAGSGVQAPRLLEAIAKKNERVRDVSEVAEAEGELPTVEHSFASFRFVDFAEPDAAGESERVLQLLQAGAGDETAELVRKHASLSS